jgi:hypothetical protein
LVPKPVRRLVGELVGRRAQEQVQGRAGGLARGLARMSFSIDKSYFKQKRPRTYYKFQGVPYWLMII